jgi:predicted esterase
MRVQGRRPVEFLAGFGIGLLAAVFAPAAVGSSPALPETSGTVAIPAQDAAGVRDRTVLVHIRYPSGRLAGVRPTTGLMLSLHNWGGQGFSGAPDPVKLVERYDVVAIGVDYLQSGDKPTDPLPYDCGCFQACDALRALFHVFQGLSDVGVAFDRTRIYTTGGSGGGNVSLMAAKFAPHTFACVVDVSGMASLTDDIAFGLPGGAGLNARYSRNPASPSFLSPGMQELRDPGNPVHLMPPKASRNVATIVSIHGRDDAACPWDDKDRVVAAMRRAKWDATLHTIAKQDVDGGVIRDSGHGIGDRTELVEKFAGRYLKPGSPDLRRLKGPTDFERRSVLRFPTSDGVVVVSFAAGWPELSMAGRGAVRKPGRAGRPANAAADGD